MIGVQFQHSRQVLSIYVREWIEYLFFTSDHI